MGLSKWNVGRFPFGWTLLLLEMPSIIAMVYSISEKNENVFAVSAIIEHNNDTGRWSHTRGEHTFI